MLFIFNKILDLEVSIIGALPNQNKRVAFLVIFLQ